MLPDWYEEYRDRLIAGIDLNEAYEYALMHDCGKPYCRVIDSDGKQHFPNHAEISYQTYLKAGGSQRIADLIKHDMDIHCLKADGIDEFCKNPNARMHLLAGLAEINSNAEHGSGFESTSFKIKYKTICQRGKAICKTLFR